MSTHSVKEQLIEKFKDKEYRDLFVAEHLYAGLALKNRLLREQRKWTQKQLGEKAGMAQAWISRLEDPNYGKLTISTLLKLASVYDVGLEINFVPFSKILHAALSFSSKSFVVPSFDSEIAALAAAQAAVLTSRSTEEERWGQIQAQLVKPRFHSHRVMARTTTRVMPSIQEVFSNTIDVSSGMTTFAIGQTSAWISTGQGSSFIGSTAEGMRPFSRDNTSRFVIFEQEGHRGRTAV